MYGDIKQYTDQICIICGEQCKAGSDFNHDVLSVMCPNCGNYSITGSGYSTLTFQIKNALKDKKHLISGYIRELTELNLRAELITSENINTYLSSSRIPSTTIDKFNKLLLYLYKHTPYFGGIVQFKGAIIYPAIAYALNDREVLYMLKTFEKNDYLTFEQYDETCISVCLTLTGTLEAEKLRNETINSDTCFVAMWFSDEMMSIYEQYISQAINDSGFKPLIISIKEHNDDINDQIISEIRKAKFVIADFTGNRDGVYYEAGFAYGLSKEVIHTCRKDWFDKGIHFDLEHKNFIIWQTGDELYQKLKARIGATIVV